MMAARQFVLLTKDKYAEMQHQLEQTNDYSKGDYDVTENSQDLDHGNNSTRVVQGPESKQNEAYKVVLEKIRPVDVRNKVEETIDIIYKRGHAPNMYITADGELILNGKVVPWEEALNLIQQFVQQDQNTNSMSDELKQFTDALKTLLEVPQFSDKSGLRRAAYLGPPGVEGTKEKKITNKPSKWMRLY